MALQEWGGTQSGEATTAGISHVEGPKNHQTGGETFGKEASYLRIIRPGADNAGALAWLEYALEHAHDRRQRRLETLLEAVRVEIVLEMKLASGLLDGRPLTDQELGEQ